MSSGPKPVHVASGARGLGVAIRVGEVQVAVTLPATVIVPQLSSQQMRTTALRLARRALAVAIEELEEEAT